MDLLPTQGLIRKGYLDSQFGQLHLRYAAPQNACRKQRPVLLLGASPSSGEALSELLLEMATDRVALALDMPGCGESSPPPAPFDHPSKPALIYARALKAMSLGPVDVYGHHSGAMLALAIAAFHPECIDHVAVSAVPFVRDKARRTALRARFPTIDSIAPLQALHAQHFAKVAKCPPALSFARAVDLFSDALRAGVKMNWLIRSSYADGTETWLPSIRSPTLFLQTRSTLEAETMDAAALIPGCVVRQRPDLDHFSLWTQAGQLGQELRRHFDNHHCN